jgi:Mn-dependent DtxR family transcriptional regulator
MGTNIYDKTAYSSALNMEAAVSYETLVRIYKTTGHRMDRNLEIHYRENIKSHNIRINHKDGVSK